MSDRTGFFWIPVTAYLLLILGLSSIPGEKMPYAIQLSPDKLLHCLEYSGFGFLLMRAVKGSFPEFRFFFRITLAVSALMALTDELYQNLIPGRFPDPLDWVFDVAGAAAGAWISLTFLKRNWLPKWMK